MNKICKNCHFNMIDPNPPYEYCWFIRHYLDTENQELFRKGKVDKCYYFEDNKEARKKLKIIKNNFKRIKAMDKAHNHPDSHAGSNPALAKWSFMTSISH